MTGPRSKILQTVNNILCSCEFSTCCIQQRTLSHLHAIIYLRSFEVETQHWEGYQRERTEGQEPIFSVLRGSSIIGWSSILLEM